MSFKFNLVTAHAHSANRAGTTMIITDISGIREATAQQMESHGFDSVEAVAHASIEQLVAVPGIGASRAAALRASANRLLSEATPDAVESGVPDPAEQVDHADADVSDGADWRADDAGEPDTAVTAKKGSKGKKDRKKRKDGKKRKDRKKKGEKKKKAKKQKDKDKGRKKSKKGRK